MSGGHENYHPIYFLSVESFTSGGIYEELPLNIVSKKLTEPNLSCKLPEKCITRRGGSEKHQNPLLRKLLIENLGVAVIIGVPVFVL